MASAVRDYEEIVYFASSPFDFWTIFERLCIIDREKRRKMPTEEGNKRREAAMAKYGQVLGEIFDDLDKDKSGFASIEEMWYVVVEKLLVKQCLIIVTW